MSFLSADEIKKIIAECNEAKKFAYCPYSNFRVGAALLTTDGQIITGKDSYVTTRSFVLPNCVTRHFQKVPCAFLFTEL